MQRFYLLLITLGISLMMYGSLYSEEKKGTPLYPPLARGELRGVPDYITELFGQIKPEDYQDAGVRIIKTKALTEISAGYNESNPRWSPSARAIAYERSEGSNKEIVVRDLKGKILDALMLNSKGERKKKVIEDFFFDEMKDVDAGYNANFSWSPDGKGFAFMSNSSQGDYDVYIGGINEKLKKIAGHKEKDGQPAWSPAGNKIAFVSGRSGKGDIYVYDIKKNITAQLTFGDKAELYPSWSPDGKRIAFISGDDDNHDICVINDIERPRESMRCLTEWFFDDLSPAWSPDGAMIAFYSNYHPSDEAGSWAIFVIKADGSDFTKGRGLIEKIVAADVIADVEAGPAWSPDSRNIFYVKNAKDEFNPIYSVDLKNKRHYKLDTGTKMNHDVVCSGDGILGFRAQVDQWDHIFIALTNLKIGVKDSSGQAVK